MAMPKDKGGIGLMAILGKPKAGGGSESYADARSILQDAWPEATDEILDALHEYIKACVAESDEPDADDMGESEMG